MAWKIGSKGLHFPRGRRKLGHVDAGRSAGWGMHRLTRCGSDSLDRHGGAARNKVGEHGGKRQQDK